MIVWPVFLLDQRDLEVPGKLRRDASAGNAGTYDCEVGIDVTHAGKPPL
jgi:hypothetical protein